MYSYLKDERWVKTGKLCPPLYKAARLLRFSRVVEKESGSKRESSVMSVVIYCGFYYRLIGGVSFGCFVIVILKCFIFWDRRAKEFGVLKCSVNIFVLFLIEKCVGQVS